MILMIYFSFINSRHQVCVNAYPSFMRVWIWIFCSLLDIHQFIIIINFFTVLSVQRIWLTH